MNELPIDYTLSESDSSKLKERFLGIAVNPYTDYNGFDAALDDIAQTSVASDLRRYCEKRRTASVYEAPFVVLRGCPVDDALPILDFDAPVVDKRRRKTTFVAEAFLLLYAKWMQQEPIGYINVNDGDIFQDIHPMRSMAQSQSQKALEEIYFHKDLANHFVRPDWVNLLGLRGAGENEVYTTFVRNKDLIENLPIGTRDVLRQNEFHTPYDDLTTYGSQVRMDEAPCHPILGGATEYDIRLFERRTRGLTARAEAALEEVIDALHRLKRGIRIGCGDFVGTANNESVHSKELRRIVDREALQNRWLMKTVNVRDLAQHQGHMLAGQCRIVNG